MKRNLKTHGFIFPPVRGPSAHKSGIDVWTCAPPARGEWRWSGNLGLALKWEVSCKHSWGMDRACWLEVGWHYRELPNIRHIEQIHEFKSCWMKSFFQTPEHWANRTWVRPRVAVPITRFPIHIFWGTQSCVMTLLYLSCPLSKWTLYRCPQHFLKLLCGGATTGYR